MLDDDAVGTTTCIEETTTSTLLMQTMVEKGDELGSTAKMQDERIEMTDAEQAEEDSIINEFRMRLEAHSRTILFSEDNKVSRKLLKPPISR